MTDTKENEPRGFTVTDRRGEAKDERSPEPAPAPKGPESRPPKSGPRTIDFATFVMSLSTSAAMHLGLVEDPVTRKRGKNLDLARQDIDILEMLAAKTKGNLTREEGQMMEEILYELRLRYVEASRG